MSTSPVLDAIESTLGELVEHEVRARLATRVKAIEADTQFFAILKVQIDNMHAGDLCEMLRYEKATVLEPIDVELDDEITEVVSVFSKTRGPVNAGRWQSFGCEVICIGRNYNELATICRSRLTDKLALAEDATS